MSPSVITFLDFFGITVFAISGALTAGHKRLDIFGVMVVALITCLGGGTLRDLILDAHPVVWFEHTSYLLAGILAALSTFFVDRLYRIPVRVLEVCDAIGLAFFVMTGLQKALSLGHSPEIALVMGLMTGVAGGIMRDIVCNEIPLIFHKEIYATAAIAGGTLFLVLRHFQVDPDIAMLIGMLTILTLRLTGIFLGLSLPAFLLSEEKKE
ncbi:trimeric intracellular cation channel family protein [Pseudomaricurvus alcaniphilus]|uniref:trimeric intracellular cation channel family protein n=1 Tax=Pseudomaricurvus alcaniphilus TaxID=1166482 RepID=UPI001408E74E|nr:trimeric intracellular cation channel family protein [Pseudomaricurvus alcaniphilus]NHN38647.1 trimeric intracellular cation channel family protein [Pseudomaricurvus alcaniphilus]